MAKPPTRARASSLGLKAVITGGDSGIGRAVSIAFSREGADLLIAYLNEEKDEGRRSAGSKRRAAGRSLVAGRHQRSGALPRHCRERCVKEFGGIDILVNNAAHQAAFKSIADITDAEWEHTFKVSIHAVFYLTKAAVPHMKKGACIINTASINADTPNPTLLAYATTKGAIQNFTAGLAQLLADKGIRANAVAPGPIWTPLIPSTMPEDAVAKFGENVPMKRPGQPAEHAPSNFASRHDPSAPETKAPEGAQFPQERAAGGSWAACGSVNRHDAFQTCKRLPVYAGCHSQRECRPPPRPRRFETPKPPVSRWRR